MDMNKFDYTYKPFNVLELPGLSYKDVIETGTFEWYKCKFGDGFDNECYYIMSVIYAKNVCLDNLLCKVNNNNVL